MNSNRFNRLINNCRFNRFLLADNGGSEPANFINVEGGDPSFSVSVLSTWVDPNGVETEVAAFAPVPYTTDGVYVMSDVASSDFSFNYVSDTVTDIKFTAIELFIGNTSPLANRTNLISVDLPNLISRTVGGWSFINCASLANLNMPKFVGANSNFNVSGCDSLEILDLPSYTTGNYPFAEGLLNLREYNCPNLVGNGSPPALGQLRLRGCPNLETVNIPSAVTSGAINISTCPSLVSVDASSLEEITSSFSGSLNFDGDTNLIDLNFPSLRSVSAVFNLRNCDSLINLNFPSLEFLNQGTNINNLDSLQSVTIGQSGIGLTYSGTLNFNGCSNLSNFSVNNLVNSTTSGSIRLGSCALPEANIDNILVDIANNINDWFSPQTLDLSGGNNAAPSAVGEAAIDILRANGWAVTVTGGY